MKRKGSALDILPSYEYIGNVDSTDAIASLSALAHGSRLQVFRVLVQKGPEGMAVAEINERVRIPATTLSFHLAQLGHAGLVTSRRNGRSIIYSADYAGMQGLMDFLMENCCQGDSRRCAPRKGMDHEQDRGVEDQLLRPDLLRRSRSRAR
jgi:DNA-binding transcriptional ArsR family regulator